MERPTAVLLDLDGTLIDSGDYWYAVVCDASVAFGGRPVERAAFDASFGQSSTADVAEFFPTARVADVDAFYNAALARHAHHIRPVEGARALLETLRRHEVPLACVTNSPTAWATAVLRTAALFPFFNALACADEVTAPKPAADLVLLAAHKLGVAHTGCVMVGDSHFDMDAARAAGVRSVGLGVPGDTTVAALRDVAASLGF